MNEPQEGDHPCCGSFIRAVIHTELCGSALLVGVDDVDAHRTASSQRTHDGP